MICNYIKLIEIRKENNLTKAAAARIAGVGYKTYWLWEEGRVQPESKKLEKLAVYYGVSLETFMTCEVIPGGKDIIESIENKKDGELIEILNSFEKKYDISSKKAAMILGVKSDKYVRWKNTLRCVERDNIIAFLSGHRTDGEYIKKIIERLSEGLGYTIDETLYLLNMSQYEYESLIGSKLIESKDILDSVVNVVKNSEEYFNLELFEEYRIKLNYTHSQYQKYLDLKRAFYSLLINGKRKRTSQSIIESIANKLAINPEHLKISENDKKIRMWKKCK